jgi:hypothetical protein
VYGLNAFADPGKTDSVVAALEARDRVRHIVIGAVAADTGKAHVTPERRGAAAPEKETA